MTKFAVMVVGKKGFDNSPSVLHSSLESAKEQAINICKKTGCETYILKAIMKCSFKIEDLEEPIVTSGYVSVNYPNSLTVTNPIHTVTTGSSVIGCPICNVWHSADKAHFCSGGGNKMTGGIL